MSEPAKHVPSANAAVAHSFGKATFNYEQSIHFPRGIPGFQDYREFNLSPLPGINRPDMVLLQSVAPDDLTFVLQPLSCDQDLIQAHDLADAAAHLDIEESDCCIMLIATLQPGSDGYKTAVNLRAPLFIDTARHLAWQVVLSNEDYPMRHMLD